MASSSQTTEILFNSPALHSLKRDQLVKLCKIHSIKASGKNVELIERLKKVAEDLPKGAPLNIALRSDAPDGDKMDVDDQTKENSYNSTIKNIPRPSEQWEVMESIAECNSEDSGSRNGTLKSLGSNREFGTGGSKSSSVSSSFRALASSLGLKHSTSVKSSLSVASGSTYNTSLISSFPEPPPPVPSVSSTLVEDELSKYATPYANLPVPSLSQMPQTDHFADFSHFNTKLPTPAALSKFDFANKEDTTPLPGHVLRPGAPAPDNARLSLGDARFSLGFGHATPRKSIVGPTTTIRLVSSSSVTGPADSPEPSTSTFDAFSSYNDTTSTPQLKPWNTTFDLVLGSPSAHGKGENVKIYPDLPMDDSPTTKSHVPATSNLSVPLPKLAPVSPSGPRADPFVFGSPLPQHRVSNAQFQTAAASVLEEMNRRLLAEGVDTVGTSLISNLHSGAGGDLTPNTKRVYADREIKPLRKSFGVTAAKKDVRDKFDKAHQNHFGGMESIATYVDRKNKIAGSSISKTNVGSSSFAFDEPVQVGRKRKSSALGDARPGPVKRPSARVISNSRRKVPGGFGDDDDEEEEEQASAEKKARVEFSSNEEAAEKDDEEVTKEKTEKEREAIRRKLELSRARRRSSAVNGRASMGRGRASVGRKSGLVKPPPKPAAKSRFGFFSTAAKSIVKGVWGGSKKASASVPAPAPAPVHKPAPVPSSNTTSAASPAAPSVVKGKMVPSSSGTQRKVSATETGPLKPSTAVSSSSIRTSHSRTASNNGTMNSLGSVAATINSARSRSPLPSFAAHTRTSSIRTSTTGTMSTRNSSVTSRAGGSSIGVGGTGTSRASTTTATSSSKISSLGTRGSLHAVASTSSRLLAPTASSLAKTAGVTKLKSPALNVPTDKVADLPSTPTTPGSGKIFSKPLVVPMGSGLPSPVRSGSSQTIIQPTGVTRQRSAASRKPRISRSKVIAKLASQRSASGPGSGPLTSAGLDPAGPSAVGLAAKRSSLGVGIHKAPRKSVSGARRSHVGVSGARSSEASVLLSAKKRARQSEYARRKSRVGPGASSSVAMDVGP